jgi:hypothetical protein
MMNLYHPQPNEHHQRLAELLRVAWGTPVAFTSLDEAVHWEDSGWLDCPNSTEPLRTDRAAWIYWRTWIWEESLPKDGHNRPIGRHAQRDLSVPEAEVMAREWAGALGLSTPELGRPAPVLVVDIDHMFAYRGRGRTSSVGGFISDLIHARFGALKTRIFGPDPFYSLTFWTGLSQRFPSVELQFFALLASEKGLYDRGVRADSPVVREAIRSLFVRFDVGTHVSYGSHDRTNGYRRELAALEEIIDRPVLRQRSHFLRNAGTVGFLSELEKLGVLEDWSLEFADATGFRAGWASSVPLAGVRQFPVAAMDQNFLGMTPREIADALHVLQRAAWSVGAPLRVGTHWRIFGPNPEVERSGKDFAAWREGLNLWLEELKA